MSRFDGESSVVIAAPAASAFELVCDTSRTPEWHKAIRKVEVLERDADGRAALVRAEVDALVARVEIDLRLSYEPHHTLRMWREAGDLHDLSACWTFQDLEDGRSRASFATEFDPGPFLSRFAWGPITRRLDALLAGQPPKGLKRAVEQAAG